jgi:hypothetical protein
MRTFDKKLRHGIRTTYIKHGCRCNECCFANSAYLKNYRRKTSQGGNDSVGYEYQKISRAALDWIITNRPDVYETLKKRVLGG